VYPKSDKNSLILELIEVNLHSKEVGMKAANLGELVQHKFPGPNGFVIKTRAYDIFLDNNNLLEHIQKTLESIDYNDYESIKSSAIIIHNSIERNSLPRKLIEEITNNFEKMEYSLLVQNLN